MAIAATKAAARSAGSKFVLHTELFLKGPLTQSGYRLSRANWLSVSIVHAELLSMFGAMMVFVSVYWRFSRSGIE
jgi:hypothetical protein